MAPDPVTQQIRAILGAQGRLGHSSQTFSEDADLFDLGMSSHASVNVMLALEACLGVEFPDRMLERSVFASIASIRRAVRELASAEAPGAGPRGKEP